MPVGLGKGQPALGGQGKHRVIMKSVNIITIFSLSAVLAGCAAPPMQRTLPASSTAELRQQSAQLGQAATDTADSVAQKQPEVSAPKQRLFQGSDQLVRLPKVTQPIKLVGEAVSLNFEQAPLEEVVQAILGDILELDYIIEHPVQGVVTLRTRSPVERTELLSILESLLKSNGVLMVRGDDDLIYISGSANMSKVAPELSNPKNLGVGYSTTVIPLQYIGAAEMAEILRPMADDGAFVRVDSKRNLLIMAGTRKQMQGWLDIVSTFDIDLLAGMSVGVFPIEYGDVATLNDALNQILGAAGNSNELAGLPIKVMPLEQLNSLLVITPRRHYLHQVKQWLERLDQAPEAGQARTLFVYPVQNATAEHLAELLSKVFSSSTGGSDSGARSSGVAPGLTQESVSQSANQGKSQSGATAKATAGSAPASVSNVALEGGVNVVADEINNALLIHATKTQYERVVAALKKLDVVPKQILIEASILEVSLRDEFRFGLEWTFSGSLGGGDIGTGLLTTGKTGPARTLPGFSYAVTDSLGNIKAVLNALASESLVNVISTPSVMALDNHEASIKVGDQQPIRSSQSSSTDGNVLTTSVEYKDTGVQLSVTPSVNAGGLVTMDIAQSVTDVGEIDEATGQRAFNTRDVKSRVAVRSGESVVLGGLIRENQTNADTGLPGLHKIPLLGNLFGKTTELGTRTELLVIITPRVISSDQDLRRISKEMRAGIRNLELIETSGFK